MGPSKACKASGKRPTKFSVLCSKIFQILAQIKHSEIKQSQSDY